jgi:hypothetical protein
MARRAPEFAYCLQKCRDGRWLVLGRNYKPLGSGLTFSDPRVDYDDCPGVRLWLRASDLPALDGGAQPYHPGGDRVWLFHDGTHPARSLANRAAYEARVAALEGLLDEPADAP